MRKRWNVILPVRAKSTHLNVSWFVVRPAQAAKSPGSAAAGWYLTCGLGCFQLLQLHKRHNCKIVKQPLFGVMRVYWCLSVLSLGKGQDSTQDRFPAHRRGHTLTLVGSLKSPVSLTFMLLDCLHLHVQVTDFAACRWFYYNCYYKLQDASN